ncbi:MAG TPA: winged helix-turn-helix domain-containing protein [Devosia sp.]|jgi:DNA-binding transcriptional ArsR family regulator|uniref:ArsR/SmtB family transcription factor n=1 Tax=Devosia sp. TaxID=1871048 RepID=UPI002F938A66
MTDDEAFEMLSALGDHIRFDYFRRVCDEAGVTATELSSGKAASTTSHHLAKLEKAGLITADRVGKTKKYTADWTKLHALAQWVNGRAEDAQSSAVRQFMLGMGD